MAKKLTLNEVKDRFNHWRQNRLNKKTPIPELLWRQAVALINEYRVSEITKTLGLSGTDFSKHRKLYANPSAAVKATQHFTQVTLATPECPRKLLSNSVEFKRQDGASLVIQVSEDQLQNTIKSFLGDHHVTNYTSK